MPPFSMPARTVSGPYLSVKLFFSRLSTLQFLALASRALLTAFDCSS